MAHLRKITLEELERRNYTESTKRAYLRTIDEFARHFNRPPDQLGPEQIREYVAHLFRDRKLADNTVNQRVGALRFFFIKTLRKAWSVEETPYPKKRLHLPVILSQDEVSRLIESALIPFHRTILVTLYATGVRRAELANLKIHDIDSQRMVGSRPGRQGTQGPRRHAQPESARRASTALSPAAPEAVRVAVPRRHAAHCRLSNQLQSRLVRLPRSRQTRRHSQTTSPAHAPPLLRH